MRPRYLRGRKQKGTQRMLDRIFAIISMLAVIAFVGVVTVGVMEPNLWIVAIVVVGITIYDFWRTIRDNDNSNNTPHG